MSGYLLLVLCILEVFGLLYPLSVSVSAICAPAHGILRLVSSWVVVGPGPAAFIAVFATNTTI